MARILCVAEKPSIAKAVAGHLSGGTCRVRDVRGIPYVKNYEFEYSFGPPWGNCAVVMTSVLGHIHSLDFPEEYRSWRSCQPAQLFDAAVVTSVDKDKKVIADNIRNQAREAKGLFIWTDCDREGEHIGSEIRTIALQGNSRLEVKRARFSNIERAHIMRAAQQPVQLDDRQVNAVAARIELDLRIGALFTRMQTLTLQSMGGQLQNKLISYGSCQFPTLGFVVDRYLRVRNFVPEPFWGIQVTHQRDDIDVDFLWNRNRLFDRMAVTVVFERCIAARTAKITKVQQKPTSHWRPLPLTTVELQKMGSRFLRMNSARVMKVAEDLYTKGFISYPRTETDQFDRGMDLRGLIERQRNDPAWGVYAQGLLAGGFRQPRVGRNNDKAHPPIHPVNYVASGTLGEDERRVYEFVVRRFLACCSEDAKGQSTTIELQYGTELFHTSGLLVTERNFLEVYPYDRWQSTRQLPHFRQGEVFEPTEAKITEGRTVPAGYLTEPELIALMDANGIGTDATMAEHIAKIKERDYVRVRSTGGRTVSGDDDDDDRTYPVANARGRGRGAVSGRGRGGGRGGARANGANYSRGGGNDEFIPTTLGVALVEGYDNVGFEISLSKPFLRKEMESRMRDICAGTKSKREVVQESLDQYREVYVRTNRQIDVLKSSFRKYVFAQDV